MQTLLIPEQNKQTRPLTHDPEPKHKHRRSIRQNVGGIKVSVLAQAF